jgi:hypothetical protein
MRRDDRRTGTVGEVWHWARLFWPWTTPAAGAVMIATAVAALCLHSVFALPTWTTWAITAGLCLLGIVAVATAATVVGRMFEWLARIDGPPTLTDGQLTLGNRPYPVVADRAPVAAEDDEEVWE